MTIAHIHAALMAEYAKDALETETPWERWEYRGSEHALWEDLGGSPGWSRDCEYRRKPIALCQVEGRDVFPGDKLWHVEQGRLTAIKMDGGNLVCTMEDGGTWRPSFSYLSWTEPARTKTVYQWAMRQGDRWFSSNVMVADKVEMIANFPNFTDFRRLDYTALEVPV